jgi:hypothetical protein
VAAGEPLVQTAGVEEHLLAAAIGLTGRLCRCSFLFLRQNRTGGGGVPSLDFGRRSNLGQHVAGRMQGTQQDEAMAILTLTG